MIIYFSDDETSNYCVSNTEMSVLKNYDESQIEKFVEDTSSSLSSFTSIPRKRSSSDTQHNLFLSSSPISNTLSDDSRSTSTPPLKSHELDESNKLCTSSKKRKICETPT